MPANVHSDATETNRIGTSFHWELI